MAGVTTLRLDDVSLEYGSRRGHVRHLAVERVRFSVQQGEVLAIIGPSGCGKTSLLSLIAGLVRPTHGSITFDGREVTGPARERTLLFQGHHLFPWKTALENIKFALRARGAQRDSISRDAADWLKRLGLEAFGHYYPHELSGGMQQRVGIARALAADPKLLLLDEPFAALDPFTRNMVHEEFLAIIRPLRKTVILVTHDIEEAIRLSDRILVMSAAPARIRKEFAGTLETTELKRSLHQMIMETVRA